MADDKNKTKADSGKKKAASSAKPKSTSSKASGKTSSKGNAKLTAAAKSGSSKKPRADFATRQRRSLIMFITAVVLIAVIFIPGEMLWLWLHNAVRGVCSVLSLYWPLLLLFFAVVTMLDREIPKLVSKTLFASGFIIAFNACIYIFTYTGNIDPKQTFADGCNYSGGGLIGLVFGIPFLKLVGQTPAKILIIAVMLVLLTLLTNVQIKNIYTFVLSSIANSIKKHSAEKKARLKAQAQAKAQVQKKTYQKVSKIPEPSSYFEDDDEDFDNDIDDDIVVDDIDDDELPQSPVFSEENTFDDEDVQIDIDIDTPMEDIYSMTEPAPAAEIISEAEDIDDDDVFFDLFDDDFVDTMNFDSDEPSEASKIAAEISKSKKNPKKSFPEQKQFDPQTVPVEPTAKRKARENDTYPYPPVELLTEADTSNNANADTELRENAKKLIDTLESFSVGAKIVGFCRGPSITRYEIQPAPGVKISKITGLSDDIALNLAAQGVRIEAPIPGKPAIGIEIPNKSITPVTIRELIDSDEFRNHKSKLACVLGRDVAGKIIITDLAAMPHLLIAGTTGSGKSVCVNGILMSLIFRASSEDVKLILIDPKLVEFSKYKGIPHLLIPVVSDSKKAAGALNWAVSEMEQRYKEFSVYNVKDIDSYNKMVQRNLETMTDEEFDEEPQGEVVDGEFIPPKAIKKMPKIVIAIDELADLMMVAPGEVEESICRLAQKARAAGMHLVIATQRPSVNVITGVIKANIPSRISLKVASYVDSKTILDTGGGEKLIGRGDMLYNPVGAAKPLRVQGGFSSDDDIEAVTDFIKKHSSADYDENISQEIDRIAQEDFSKGGKDSGADSDIDDSDPMLEDAIKLVVEAGQASTSLLQRRLRLGYARAGRLIDTMEQMGIVGPHEGSKSRKVLLTYEQWLERKVTGSVD